MSFVNDVDFQDDFRRVGEDATAGFEAPGAPSSPTERAGSENLAVATKAKGAAADPDELEEDEDDDDEEDLNDDDDPAEDDLEEDDLDEEDEAYDDDDEEDEDESDDTVKARSAGLEVSAHGE